MMTSLSSLIQNKSIRALFFDLDGTLMDTDDQAVEKLIGFLAKIRFRNAEITARRWIMALETPANSVMTVLDLVGLEGLVHLLKDIRHSIGLRGRSEPRLMAGSGEMLQSLSESFKLAIVTTRSRKDTRFFLSRYDLDRYFDAVVTRESTWRIKPHPAPVRRAAELCGVPAARCAMIGDTPPDMKSARSAGASAVGVLCGFGERDELLRAGAQIVIEHTSQIAAFLQY
jgi:HAD superfamily hydrolase (TIGR01509 family)